MKTEIDGQKHWWETLLLPSTMAFLSLSIYYFGTAYSDALFLSTYPREWLTYYFFASPVITVVMFIFVTPFISRATSRQSFLFVLGMEGALLINYELMRTGIFVMPFILALFVSVFSKLITAISWNAIATALDIRVFKKHVFQFNILGTIGAISTAFSVPLIIHFFHSPGVFYALIIASTLIGLCILKLTPLAHISPKRKESIDKALYKQPYFKYLVILTILGTTIHLLANFAFKVALVGHYSQNELANFISIFNGAVNTVCLLFQVFVSLRLIIWIGLSAMLLILPVCGVVLGGIVTIWPTFIPFLALKAIITILEVNTLNPCMPMLVNPYPSILRKKINFYLSGPGRATGGLLAALLIVIINHLIGLHLLGVFLAALSLYWIYITRKSNQGYQEILHSALKENRYNPDLLLLTPETVVFMYNDILKALKSGDINIRRTGLEFFEDRTFATHLPQHALLEKAIIPSLREPDNDIRYKAAVALKTLNATTASNALLNQLNQEEDETAGWAIIDTLVSFNIFTPPDQAIACLETGKPFQIAYALVGLMKSNQQPCLHNKALEKIDDLLKGDSSERLLLAKTWNYLNVTSECPSPLEANIEKELRPGLPSSATRLRGGRLFRAPSPHAWGEGDKEKVLWKNNQILQALIHDKSTDVSIAAIIALKPDTSQFFVPTLLELLNSKQKAYFAEAELADYKEHILDALLLVNINTPRRQRRSMLRLLARLNQHAALNKLIELSKTPSITLRLSIANKVQHFSNYDLTQTAIKESIIDMIQWCAREIRTLLRLDHENNDGVRREINLQIHINRKVFIIWYGLLTDRWRVATIAKYIEKPEQYLHTDVSKAYELLDNLATNVTLRQAVYNISQTYPQDQRIKNQHDINPGIVLLAKYPC